MNFTDENVHHQALMGRNSPGKVFNSSTYFIKYNMKYKKYNDLNYITYVGLLKSDGSVQQSLKHWQKLITIWVVNIWYI